MDPAISFHMAASNWMESWTAQDPPQTTTYDRTAILSISQKDRSSLLTQRFEAEAMPHLNDIFRTASRMTGEKSRAEDVVQEVYLQAWKSFDRFQAGTNCRAWLYKILFHCVNHHRRKWFQFPMLKQTEQFLEANLAYEAPIPEHLTDQEILAALDRVPPDFRAVLLLVDVEEFPYKEAAEILGVPIGTVMSRLSRGRKALREQLAEVAKSYGIGVAPVEGGDA